jgi:hypothetical protein
MGARDLDVWESALETVESDATIYPENPSNRS